MINQNSYAITKTSICILTLCLYFIQLGDVVVARFFFPLTGLLIYLTYYLSRNSIRTLYKLSDLTRDFTFYCLFFICLWGASFTSESTFFDLIKVYFALLSFYVGRNLSWHINNNNEIKKATFYLLIVSLIFLSIELYLRVFVNFGFSLSPSNFYLLKVDSPFFFDSNAVGIYILCLFCYIFIFFKKLGREKYIYLLFLFFFQCASFSRAAILSCIVLGLIYLFINLNHLTKLLISSILIISFTFYVGQAINLVGSDGSGATKLEIFKKLPELYFQYNLIEQLFGFGIQNGNFAYSYLEGSYAHALIPMLLGELGIIGLTIYFIFWVFWGIKAPYTLYVFIPFFIIGFSYLPPFTETYFFIGGLASANNLIKKKHA